ncbi:multidrug ABC transporter ATP-binding protein [Novosphingobium sp. PC22D]|uniref:ABC transporter ATP-binding protein n=1 Tax=Novosphingobium sp. PC22D TaxID=1962403 RepID=UPI000BF1B1E2|nr:ABC transporter ATP-binding protein [Novosphingobium sp. PC22D]PEQ10207.1 multidrug ABC transporter ATP-binding protein [Novosphingobium sp. PC22D]
MSAAEKRSTPVSTAARPASASGGPAAAGAAIGGEKPKDARDAARRIWQALGRSRWVIVTMVLLSVGSVAASTLGPWQLGKATDLLVSEDFPRGALIRQLTVVAVIYLLASAFNLAQAWLINDLVQELGRDLRHRAQAKLSRVPLSWFDAQPRGEVLSRFTNDIDNVIQNLQQVASQVILMVLTIVGVLGIMLVLSPVLAIVALVALGISLLLSRLLTRAARPQFVAQWRETGNLNSTVEESFTGQTLIRVFGAHSRIEEQFAIENGALTKASMSAQMLASLIQPVTMVVTNFAYVAVVVVGAFRVLSGGLTLGELQAFIQYIRQIGQPISQLGSMAAQVQSALASAERVFELLDAPEMGADGDARGRLPAVVKGHVCFDHVGFRYVPDQPLFEDVSLEALPGQTLAIVGPTGAGKTTLVNLLMRFYEIDRGEIRLDGIDISQLGRAELRGAMAMVLQDTWLFTGTIHDNIAYGRPQSTREEVLAAARRCHVDDFVRTLPEGYDTVLENAGASLSQGQRQLMTIARAFLLDKPILILDEATSSVDTRTEMLIQQAMADLRQGRTSFVIAHRLSTIRDADLIVYMEAGNVRETGTHDELMALKGGYWTLQQGGAAYGPLPE